MGRRVVFTLFAVFASCFSYRVQAQLTISTLAGTGVAAYSGDGSLATTANINTPYGVAVDGSGNVYLQIITITASARWTLLASSLQLPEPALPVYG